MINFKNPDDKPTSMAIVGSLVVMAGAVLCIALLPPPAPKMAKADFDKAKRKVMIGASDDKKKIESAQTAIAAQTWTGSQDEVMPLALQKITAMTQAHHLKLVGFHPQKPIELPFITILPCIVNVDGPFPQIIDFERDVETPGTKMAINISQFASADQTTNKITASIGFVAYQPVKDTSSTNSTSGGATTPAAGGKPSA